VIHAFYEFSLLNTKSKNPRVIYGTLIKPCSLKDVEEILGKEQQKQKFETFPYQIILIGNMVQDNENQLVRFVKKSPYFALQCDDEAFDAAYCYQMLIIVKMLIFVRFLNGNITIEK